MSIWTRVYCDKCGFLMGQCTCKKVSPMNGGCWFCYRDHAPLVFDVEFDTCLHINCLKEAVKDENNQEAQIMSYLLPEDYNNE